MFLNLAKDNETTRQSSRPFSQSFRKTDDTIKKVFVPFRQERDKLGRLLQSSLGTPRTCQNPQLTSKKMKQYLMNTIHLDRDIKYQGFTVNEAGNLKVRNKSAIGKKLLVSKIKADVIPFYDGNKDYILKRPKSAMILKCKDSRSVPRPPSEYKSVEKSKKNIYSFKFSYPKSVTTYQDVPVSDQDIRKVQEMTTAENRRKRIREELPLLMFVENVKICAKPEDIHESWHNITMTKQDIINKMKRVQYN